MEWIAGRDNSKENACTGDLQLRKQDERTNLLRGGRKLKDRRWYSCALEVGDGYEKTDIRTNDKKIKVACDNRCDACCIRNGWNRYCSVYHMKYALKSLFNMEFNTGNDSWLMETSLPIIRSGNGQLR